MLDLALTIFGFSLSLPNWALFQVQPCQHQAEGGNNSAPSLGLAPSKVAQDAVALSCGVSADRHACGPVSEEDNTNPSPP